MGRLHRIHGAARRRVLPVAAALLLLAGALASADAGPYEDAIERFGFLFNDTTVPQDDEHLPPPTPFVQGLHDAIPFVADLHCDRIVYQPADDPDYQVLLGPAPGGHPVYRDLFHVDVPRLLAGNVALQVLSVFTKGSIDTYARSFDGLGELGEPITRCELAGVAERDGACHRADYNRDPDRAAYDDPGTPYAVTFGPLRLDRDPLHYLDRLQGWPCILWHDPRVNVLTDPDGCPDFDADRLYFERLLLRARLVREAAERDPRLVVVRTAQDLEVLQEARAGGAARVGALIAAEGLYLPNRLGVPFEDLLDRRTGRLLPPERVGDPGYARLVSDFETLYEAGYRMMGLTHFLDNDYGGSSTGMGKFGRGHDAVAPGHTAAPDPADDRLGLSEEGRTWVQLMLEHGVVIDVAHAAPPLLADVARVAMAAGVPIVSSHGGVSSVPGGTTDLCRVPRNLDRGEILDVAATGGVVGIGYDPGFTCGDTPADIARTLRYVVDLVDDARIRRGFSRDPSEPVLRGVDHVALGSDFDGGIVSPVDAAHLSKITEALVCRDGVADPDAPPELLCTGLRREAGGPVEIAALDRPLDHDDGPGEGLAGSSLSRALGENALRVIEEVLACRATVCSGVVQAPRTETEGEGGCGCSAAPPGTHAPPPAGVALLMGLCWLSLCRRRFRGPGPNKIPPKGAER